MPPAPAGPTATFRPDGLGGETRTHHPAPVASPFDEELRQLLRSRLIFVHLIGTAADVRELNAVRTWVRALHEELSEQAQPGRMPNFSDGDDQAAIERFGPDNARRLQALHERYDPQGLFANPALI